MVSAARTAVIWKKLRKVKDENHHFFSFSPGNFQAAYLLPLNYRRVVSSQETGQEGSCSLRDGIRRLLRPRLLCGAPCCHTERNDPVHTGT